MVRLVVLKDKSTLPIYSANGLGSRRIVWIVQNSERYFPYLWKCTGVNECICLKFASFWVDFWRFSGLKSWIIVWSQKFVTFWVWKCWKFVLFMDFLDAFSAWSHELKWRCRISFPSVTGKVQNLQRIYMKFAKMENFWSELQTHWRSKLVHCKGFWSESTLCNTFKVFNRVWGIRVSLLFQE